ncbi:MAG TPA: class I SAM-dependent methyltransferase [Gaiellaceae bacterium]|jgi:SAM-dependent methyltransferase
MDEAFARHYANGVERDRLVTDGDSLELVRTLALLQTALPPPPARILDVGGGPGIYAARLAAAGYDVGLVDVHPLHVEQARAHGTFDAALGDARRLDDSDESADAVLLLGPLYHLTKHEDRIQALSEARRVVRAGGLVAVAVIHRFASLLDGTRQGFLADPRFVEIVKRDLLEGQHRNPDNVEGWFTTAYFHLPYEICEEVEASGLTVERLVGVEGPGGWFEASRDVALTAAGIAEDIPA